MAVRFETADDLRNEEDTIREFCENFGLGYGKLAYFDIDFYLSKEGYQIGEAEVKCYTTPHDKYDHQILSSRKYLTLMSRCFAFARTDEMEYRPMLVCRYSDGVILYVNFRTLIGKIPFPEKGGRAERLGSANDQEWIVKIPKNLMKKL